MTKPCAEACLETDNNADKHQPHPKQKDYTKMYGLQELKNRLYNRIHDTRNILEGIETPIKDQFQEVKNKEHIRVLNEPILNANTDLIDIEADHKNSIGAAELEDLKISLYDIERKTSTAYNDLCTWKAKIKPPVTIAASKLKNAAQQEKADHDTLKQGIM